MTLELIFGEKKLPKFSNMHEDNVEDFIDEIHKITHDFYALQNRVEELSCDGNCLCEQDKNLGTLHIQPDVAGEIEVCLQCFGARESVY